MKEKDILKLLKSADLKNPVSELTAQLDKPFQFDFSKKKKSKLISKKKGNPWVAHVREVAKKMNVPYGCAISYAAKSYKTSKTIEEIIPEKFDIDIMNALIKEGYAPSKIKPEELQIQKTTLKGTKKKDIGFNISKITPKMLTDVKLKKTQIKSELKRPLEGFNISKITPKMLTDVKLKKNPVSIVEEKKSPININSINVMPKEDMGQNKKKKDLYNIQPTSLNSIIENINNIMDLQPKQYRNNLDNINKFFYNLTKNQNYDYARNIINARNDLDFVYTPEQCLLKFKEVVNAIKYATYILEPTAGMGHMVNVINKINTDPNTKIYVNDFYKPFTELLKSYDPFTQNRLIVDNINFISEDSFKYLDIPIELIVSNPPYTNRTDKYFYYDFLFRYLYLLNNNAHYGEKIIIIIIPDLRLNNARDKTNFLFEQILESMPKTKLLNILEQYKNIDNNFSNLTLKKINDIFKSNFESKLGEALLEKFSFNVGYNLGKCEEFTTTNMSANVYMIVTY